MKRSRYAIKCTWPDEKGNVPPDRFMGFSPKYESIAKNLRPGDKMLVYATMTRKILGAIEVPNGRRPYSPLRSGKHPHRVRCRWLVNVPRSKGVKPSSLGWLAMNPQVEAYRPITPGQFAEGLAALLR